MTPQERRVVDHVASIPLPFGKTIQTDMPKDVILAAREAMLQDNEAWTRR